MPDNNTAQTPPVVPVVVPATTPASSDQDKKPLPGEIGQDQIGELDSPANKAGEGQPDDGLAFLTDDTTDEEDDSPDEEGDEEEDDDEEDEEADEETSEDPDGQTPDPKDEKQVRRLMEKYKNDPAALARAVLANQRAISRKALEDRQQAQLQPTAQAVAPALQPPAEESPLSFSIPDPSTLYNPAAESISERGYPIDPATQKEYIPHDELGVSYNLPEYYQAKVREMLEADPEGDVPTAILKVQQLERNDLAQYHRERSRREGELWQVQQQIGRQHVQKLAQDIVSSPLGLPAPVATRIANHFYEMGKQAAEQVRATGQRDPALIDPGVLASAAELFFFNAFRSGDLMRLAAHFAGTPARSLPGEAASKPARATVSGNTVTPPVGNNGSAAGGLTKDQKRLVKSGMSESDVRKYSDPKFKFED